MAAPCGVDHRTIPVLRHVRRTYRGLQSRDGLFPPLISGLTANSGMGLLVLMRESRDARRDLTVVALLIVSAGAAGLIAQLLF